MGPKWQQLNLYKIMKKENQTKEYTIDAKGKKLGRLATEISMLLQGKNDPSFDPSKLSDVKVKVENLKDVEVSGKKAEQKIYYRHAGRLGHLKEVVYSKMFEKKPEWVLKHAVRLMLPKNKLAKKRLQNLIIEDK
jgi:large subunit ribosomal protein L13